jgi:hypothetical protein
VDPRTDSVWVRLCHAAAGGSFNTTRPTVAAEPRSTVIDCGNALFALSQYELASASTALPATYGPLALVAVTGRPAARLPAGSKPVPVNPTVSGLALEFTVSAPVREPAAVGRNVTLAVHVAPAASVAGQVLVCAKSPFAVTPESATGADPVLRTVTWRAPLVVPTFC